MLDTLPGEVRSGGPQGKDHPAKLISSLQRIPRPIENRSAVVDYLSQAGFSMPIARWMTTNLRPMAQGVAQARHLHSGAQGLQWGFDLDGIAEMYKSYESHSLWPLLEQPPEGLSVDFVRAENSNFRWEGPEETLIQQLGHRVHLLRNAGHWVHTDNPTGLFDIMAATFGKVDLHMKRGPSFSRR